MYSTVMSFQLSRYPKPILEANPDTPWEAGSLLNPGVVQTTDGKYHMLYRATNGVRTQDKGSYISSIGHAISDDGISFTRHPDPLIKPDQVYELGLGCEDPRITEYDGTYYIYYTAVTDTQDDLSIRTALATTKDFVHIVKHGIVGPKGGANKGSSLLPEPVKGEFIMYFTWMSDSPGSSIMATRFKSLQEVIAPPEHKMAETLEYYDTHVVVRPNHYNYAFRGPELGAPPLKTEKGWLMIYCGTNRSTEPLWTINALLLDLDDPTKVIARLPEPILRPQTERERVGVVDSVAFPSAAIVKDGALRVYYGSADQGIMLATCKLDDLLIALDDYPVTGSSFAASEE